MLITKLPADFDVIFFLFSYNVYLITVGHFWIILYKCKTLYINIIKQPKGKKPKGQDYTKHVEIKKITFYFI